MALVDGKDAADVVQKDPQLLLKAVKGSVSAMDYFFNIALGKYDKNSASGKNNIAKEILAHVANMENKIERSHWMKKIAHELDVEENVMNDVLRTVAKNSERYVEQKSDLSEESTSFQKRSDIIKNSLIGVIISDSEIWKDVFEKNMEKDWVKNDSLLQFVFEKGAKADFSFDKLLVAVEDDRIIEKFRKIYFDTKYRFTQEGIIEQSQDDLKQLVDGYMNQYIKELQKERLHSIIREIENAEHKGDKETLAKLMSEFTKLSQEM